MMAKNSCIITRKARLVLLMLIIMGLSACSSTPVSECEHNIYSPFGAENCQPLEAVSEKPSMSLGVVSYRPDTLIATDLVNALTQLRPYDTTGVAIRMPAANSPFMAALEQVLVDRGYTISRAERRTGKNVLMSSVVKKSEASSQFTYMVAIDRVALKRDYFVGQNRIVAPVSSLFVRGAAPDMIELNDGLFVAQ